MAKDIAESFHPSHLLLRDDIGTLVSDIGKRDLDQNIGAGYHSEWKFPSVKVLYKVCERETRVLKALIRSLVVHLMSHNGQIPEQLNGFLNKNQSSV